MGKDGEGWGHSLPTSIQRTWLLDFSLKPGRFWADSDLRGDSLLSNAAHRRRISSLLISEEISSEKSLEKSLEDPEISPSQIYREGLSSSAMNARLFSEESTKFFDVHNLSFGNWELGNWRRSILQSGGQRFVSLVAAGILRKLTKGKKNPAFQ